MKEKRYENYSDKTISSHSEEIIIKQIYESNVYKIMIDK